MPMVCTTIRKGVECLFMTAKGCSYTDGICYEIVEKCDGCNRSVEFPSGWFCTASPEPSMKWKSGNCNLASHIASAASAKTAKINPLKASKRASKKK